MSKKTKPFDCDDAAEQLWQGEEPQRVLAHANRAEVDEVLRALWAMRRALVDDVNIFIEEKWGQGG